jgi:hypothetical protein
MGSGAQVQWTGIDKVIRDRFPEDYQGRLGAHVLTVFMKNPIHSMWLIEIKLMNVLKKLA